MIKLPAYFTSFGSKADGSARLGFASQELTDQDFAELKRNLNNFGWLTFHDVPVIEVPKEEITEDKDKTPSKRLRAVLFIQWKKEKPFSDFDTWYRKEMEGIIENRKDKLE